MNILRYTFVAVMSAFIGYLFAIGNTPIIDQQDIGEPTPTLGSYTSYEVFDDINRYRTSKGKHALSISDRACNNIATRWQSVTKEFSHRGFDEFVTDQIKTGRFDTNRMYSELLVEAYDRASVVDLLAQSMSHNEIMLSPGAEGMCVYTDGLTTVILLESY